MEAEPNVVIAETIFDDHGLGRLENVDPRNVWANEATDFTPWLQANLGLLTEALGLDDLVTVEREVPVGPFSLDLLGEDASGSRTIIENQLTPSDHSHLGQLLVYAAGKQANTVVWVTTRFRDEYRAVLDWLNGLAQEVDFFGVEVGVVKIGASPPAPVFDVVAQPNAWGKAQQQAQGTPSALALSRQEFFRQVFEALAEKLPHFRVPSPGLNNWVSFKSGPFGTYSVAFSQLGLRVEVYLDSGFKALNKALFDELYSDREGIAQELGDSPTWERIDDKRASRLAIYYGPLDLQDDAESGKAIQWAADRSARLITALDERLRTRAKELKPSFAAASEDSDEVFVENMNGPSVV